MKKEKDRIVFYDENNIVFEKTINGCVLFYNNGNLVHSIFPNGNQFLYDEKGNPIYKKLLDGTILSCDKNGQFDVILNDNKPWQNIIKINRIEYGYDFLNEIAYIKNMVGDVVGYNSYGDLVYYKSSTGRECWYDTDGNLIHKKDLDGTETWYDNKTKESRILIAKYHH